MTQRSINRPTLVGVAILAACLLTSPLAAQATAYVAYGDSITAGTGDTEPEGPGAGYPVRLEGLLVDSTVLNRGQSNGTTLDLLERFDAQIGNVDADTMLLMIGTNDVARDAIAIEDSIFNINQLYRRASNSGMDTVQATVINRWPRAKKDPDNIETQQLNEAIRDYAGINGRPLVDVNERFLQEPRAFALYYSNANPDDVVGHPSPTGYDQIAGAFGDALQDIDTANPAPGRISPTNGQKRVARGARVQVDLWDFGTGIDATSIELRVNGQPVTVDPIISGRRASLIYSAPSPFLGQVTVGVTARDSASPPNEINREIAKFFTVQTNFPTGDVNRDGRVDGKDLLILARGFGLEPADFRHDPDADLDQDGDIDGNDLAILVENFGVSL